MDTTRVPDFRLKASWLFLTGLVLAGIWTYHNSFSGAMIFDDHSSIIDDPFVRLFGPWQSLLNGHRPMLRVTLALNYAWGGQDVFGYHVVNLLIHLGAGLALFGVVRRTLHARRLKAQFSESQASLLAFVIALLWLVHPLQTGSVTYIVQRSESLMGMMYLTCLYCVIRGAHSSRAWLWYSASFLSFTIGVASKEVMASALVVIPIYDRIFLSNSWKEVLRRRWGIYLAAYLPGIIWLCVNILPVMLPPSWTSSGGSRIIASAGFNVPGLSPFRYAISQPEVILHYLKLAFWPHPLVLDYGWQGPTDLLEVLVPGLILVGLLAMTVWALIKHPAIGFAGAAFFLILAPTSSVIPILDLAFEHRMYLSLSPVIVLVVLGGRVGLRRLPLAQNTRIIIQSALVALIAVSLSTVTILRNEAYQSPITIWSSVLDVYPNNLRAHINLGNAYAQAGQQDQALSYYRKAMTLHSNDPRNLYNLGYALQSLGQDEAARQIYQAALNLVSYNQLASKANNQLGLLALKQDQTEQAATYFKAAIRIRGDFAIARSNLAGILLQADQLTEAHNHLIQAIRDQPTLAAAHYQLGLVFEKQGNTASAIASYREALIYDDQYLAARERLQYSQSREQNTKGLEFVRQGRIKEALSAFEAAIQYDPDFYAAYNNLGNVRVMQGQYQDAILRYRESLQINSEQPGALSNLAWIFATNSMPEIRNPDEAIQLSEQAYRLSKRADPRLLDTRAAAYAAAGRFDRAIADMRQAIRLAGADAKEIVAYQNRLTLYRKRQPYRE